MCTDKTRAPTPPAEGRERQPLRPRREGGCPCGPAGCARAESSPSPSPAALPESQSVVYGVSGLNLLLKQVQCVPHPLNPDPTPRETSPGVASFSSGYASSAFAHMRGGLDPLSWCSSSLTLHSSTFQAQWVGGACTPWRNVQGHPDIMADCSGNCSAPRDAPPQPMVRLLLNPLLDTGRWQVNRCHIGNEVLHLARTGKDLTRRPCVPAMEAPVSRACASRPWHLRVILSSVLRTRRVNRFELLQPCLDRSALSLLSLPAQCKAPEACTA